MRKKYRSYPDSNRGYGNVRHVILSAIRIPCDNRYTIEPFREIVIRDWKGGRKRGLVTLYFVCVYALYTFCVGFVATAVVWVERERENGEG